MNGSAQISTRNEELSPSTLYLESVKGVLLLWHEEIMGRGGDTHNLNSVLIDSAQEIAACLQSEESRQELQYVHELVMKAIEVDRLEPALKPLSLKREEQLLLLSKHFDNRYENILDVDLSNTSLPILHQNGSLLDYSAWNGSDNHHLEYTQNGEHVYTQAQFEEKLSQYTQKLTLNLERKYIKELEDLNKKHETTRRQIESFYENKLAEDKVNSSFSKIESNDEMQALIHDRDNLRQMTENLRQVVTDLTNYVSNCETQLNKTLLNELLDDTSGIDDCSSFQQLKHVHFAPDISTLISEDKLDYSDLRQELDTCLDRLKREAAQLLSLTTSNKCKHASVEELVAKYEREIEMLKQDAVTPEMQSLQHQIEAADAQLKSSRQFLEEQAAEREAEREELLAQISQLKAQIRDQKHVVIEDTEAKILEDKLDEAQKLIQVLTEEKQSSEDNLNEAKTKIWELREIVSSLEKELASVRESEAGLARKISEYQELFEKEYQSHQQLVLEFETLKMSSKNQGLEVESAADLASLHQIKSQILWLERSLQRRTKELETLYVFDANLSSPSEDISARDEMVNTPDSGRVDSPGLPLEQITSLYEQFVRHSRAEDATVKCLKDTVLQLTAVRGQLNDVQHERDALQGRYNKTLTELSEAKVQLEELRHNIFNSKSKQYDEKHAEMDLLEDKVKTLAKALLIKEDEIKEKEKLIEAKDRMMWSLEQELSSKDITDYRLRDVSHVSHAELRPKRINQSVRFNDTTLNETHGFSFEKNRRQTEDQESLLDQNKMLKEQLLEKERIILEIKTDADSLKRVLNELQEKVTEAKRHSENMTDQQNIIDEYKLEIGNTKESVERYEKEIEELKQELEEVNEKLESANNNKDELKKEMEILNEKVKQIGAESNRYKVEADQLKAENNQLKSHMESCEKEIDEFYEEFPVLNGHTASRSKNRSIRNCVETLKKELTSYIEKDEMHRREREDINQKDIEYQKKIADLKLRETEFKKKVQAMEEGLRKYENEVDGLKQNEILLNNQLDRLNLTCEVYKNKALDLDRKEELIKKLKDNIDMGEQNYVKLEMEVNELRRRERKMVDDIRNKEQEIETLKESEKEECEQCREYLQDQTTRFSSQFPPDQSTASFDIKSLKDEMFSELAEKLKKELQLSAKLDEKLLNKQKDLAYEEQDRTIHNLNEERRKLRELIISERARFESEQLEDADLLEKLRQKLESTKDNSKKIINDLETEIKSVAQEKNDLLNKMKLLETAIETYKSNLNTTSRNLKELEIVFSEQKTLLEVTQVQVKTKTDELISAKERISALEKEVTQTKEKLAKNEDDQSSSDLQNVIKDQMSKLNEQATKICQLEKLFTEQKCQQANKEQLEERIKSLNQTLMQETKKVLRLEAEIKMRKTEIAENAEVRRSLQENLKEKEMNLDIERERVVTLREKLLEKSNTLADELEKTKRLEDTIQRLHHERDLLVNNRHNEVEHGKQMRQVLARLMRAESCNKSLVFQKRYLKNMINSYVRMECRTVQMLEGRPHAPVKPKRTFRCVVFTIIAIARIKYLRRKRSTTILRTLK